MLRLYALFVLWAAMVYQGIPLTVHAGTCILTTPEGTAKEQSTTKPCTECQLNALNTPGLASMTYDQTTISIAMLPGWRCPSSPNTGTELCVLASPLAEPYAFGDVNRQACESCVRRCKDLGDGAQGCPAMWWGGAYVQQAGLDSYSCTF